VEFEPIPILKIPGSAPSLHIVAPYT
jgi:hypothetical protein